MTVRYEGRVQGVGFRFRAREAATTRALSGWVRNEPDGSVSLAAEGQKAALLGLLGDIRRGPLGRHVFRETVAWSTASGEEKGFRVV